MSARRCDVDDRRGIYLTHDSRLGVPIRRFIGVLKYAHGIDPDVRNLELVAYLDRVLEGTG